MALKPDASVMAGLATAGVVYAIHTNMTPSAADVSALPAGNKDVDIAERQATWMSIGVVSAISLLAKDPTIFVLGSVATVGMALLTRNANWRESTSGLLDPGPAQHTSANDAAAGPQMTDTQAVTMFSRSEFVSS